MTAHLWEIDLKLISSTYSRVDMWARVSISVDDDAAESFQPQAKTYDDRNGYKLTSCRTPTLPHNFLVLTICI